MYACRAFTCSPPTDDVEEALAWSERLAPSVESDPGPNTEPDLDFDGNESPF